jgi:putative glutamine transport system substrate-binding protein
MASLGVQGQQTWQEVKNTQEGALTVHFYENYPFSYTDSAGNPAGVEIDMIQFFEKWMKASGGYSIALNYVQHSNFDEFYAAVQSGAKNTVGLGTVSITKNRLKEIQFTEPYVKNVSVLVSQVGVPTLRGNNMYSEAFEGKTALTIKGSVHEEALQELKSKYLKKLKIEYKQTQEEILNAINENNSYFGYVDVVTFWAYNQNKTTNLKVHRLANINREKFGFILPLESDWNVPFQQFFESGFGFTASKKYMDILHKHLSYEIIETIGLN